MLTQAEKRERNDAGEIGAPPTLLLQTWFRMLSVGLLGVFFCLGLPIFKSQYSLPHKKLKSFGAFYYLNQSRSTATVTWWV